MKKKKRCGACKKVKLICNFHKLHSRYDGLRPYCKPCTLSSNKKFSSTRKQLVEYLSDKSCTDCGEDNIYCLQFDHINDNKKHSVSNMIGRYTWNTVIKEIEKCEIVCANCHAKRTAKQQKWYAWENK